MCSRSPFGTPGCDRLKKLHLCLILPVVHSCHEALVRISEKPLVLEGNPNEMASRLNKNSPDKPNDPFSELTWDDLEEWAGSRIGDGLATSGP